AGGVPAPAVAAIDLVDTSFNNPNVGSFAMSMAVQSDGKILVGGTFTTAGPNNTPYGRLARFNADGSLDTTFANPAFNNSVYAIAVQSDGKIIVVGEFSSVGSSSYSRAVRLNSDGSIDTGFANPLLGDATNTIVINDNGSILFGGRFTTAGGQTYKGVARYSSSGTVDTTFTNPNLGGGFGGNVNSIAVTSSGKLLVGGTFSTAGPSNSPYVNLARLNADGTLDTGFSNPAFDGAVNTLAVQGDGKILVGGTFANVASTARGRMARLEANGALDTGFANPSFNSTVKGLVVQGDGRILVTGWFSTAGATNTPYGGLIRLTSAGAIDPTLPNPFLNQGGYALALLTDGKILVTGSSTTAGASNTTYGRLARFFGAVYTLSMTAPANGTVTSNVGGLNCGSTCSAQAVAGQSMVLTATPAAGYGFAGWGGSCSGTSSPLTVTLSDSISCTASFTADGGSGGGTMLPPAPPPAFVTTPVTSVQNAATVGSGTGTLSLAASFTDPQNLTFTATQTSGAPLPSWLTFNPATVSFAYDVPLPPDLPVQPLAADARVDSRAAWSNTIYPLLVRAAQVPVMLTATGGGQSYVSAIRMDFYAPRSPVAMSAVSLSLDGARGNGRSGRSALSWDGGQMVFETAATNIFPASANSFSDIVRYQALSGNRDRLSQTAIPGGGVANAADGASTSPAVSSDGRHAAFASEAPSISTPPYGGVRQVYRTGLGYPRVPLNGTVTPAPDMVSVTASGVAGNAASDNPVLSQDGRYVAFESAATNFGLGVSGQRRIWRKDAQTGTLEAVSTGSGQNPSISWDGRYVAFDDGIQVYLRDMTTSAARLIAQGTKPRLTARADRLAFVSGGQVMLAEVATGALRAVTAGNGISDDPAISADGRFVAFRSAATDLVAGFAGNGLAQVFVRDVERGVTALVTQTATGGPGNGASWSPALSGDGGTIAFASDARDLVNGNPAPGQAYLAANPLPLPAKTGYWYLAGIGGGQGWVMERWGSRAYVGGLAYDGQGRSQWLAGFCTLSGLTCSGTLTAAGAAGPAFTLVTAATGNGATLSVGSAPAQALTPFPIGGSRTTGYAGLPQAGWWYEAGAGNNVGYFLAIDSQPQADGSVAQIGYLSVLAYDTAGRPVWQSAQATLGADLGFSGTLKQNAGGAPVGATAAAAPASAAIVGPVRLTFDGSEAARITLPDGRTASLARFRF
ncbi:MAG: InlB B-repeat-containing protein, partial [Ferrovibrionaceae bacterium]